MNDSNNENEFKENVGKNETMKLTEENSTGVESTNIKDNALVSEKRLAMIIYVLQAASFINGITLIAAIIINYIKRKEVQGTWLESHFRWQIRTFWIFLLLMVIGSFTLFIFIGFLLYAAGGIFLIYRIVVGWLRLNEGKPCS